MKRHYFLITDLEHNKDYLYWAYSNNDIQGTIVAFAKRQDCKIENIRVYPFDTKKEWEEYGRQNFHRITLWLCTSK